MSSSLPTQSFIPYHAASTGLHAVHPSGVCLVCTCSTYRSITNLELAVGMRSNIIRHHFQDQASPQDRAYVSALCGGLSGGVVTRLMGMRLISLWIFALKKCLRFLQVGDLCLDW